MSQRVKFILYNPAVLNLTLNKTAKCPSVRAFSEISNHQKLPETPLYKKKYEFKITQKASVKKLEELFMFRPFVAKEIVLKYKKFLKISSCDINENYYICIKNGVTKETLTMFPEVLAELDLSLKINNLRKLPYDINAVTPLLSVNFNTFKMFVTDEVDTKRIQVLSNLLELEQQKLSKHFVQKTFLLSQNLKELTEKIKLLLDFGITKEEIIKDLWVLRYSSTFIKKKLSLAKENNIETLKTWMVRVQPEIFERYIKRRSDTKLILGDNSLAEYLSERLQCPEEVAKYLISKQPALQNKSLTKMNEMIEFLYKQGFQPIHIRRVPKILLHSVETTKKRLKELEVQGMHLDTLSILTKSQRQYMQYYETLIKSNKNKLKS